MTKSENGLEEPIVDGLRLGRRPSRMRLEDFLQKYALIIALGLLAFLFQVLTDGLFLSSTNVPILLRQAAVLGIVTMGSSLILIMGELDLSIGSAVGLCAVVVAFLMKEAGWSVPLAIVAAGGVGLVLGTWQGFAISVMRVPAFVVTLAGLLIYRGISLVITQGTTIASFPRSFQMIAQGSVSLIHVVIMSALVVGIYASWLVYRSARYGERPSRRVLARFLLLVIGAIGLIWFTRGQIGLPTPVLIMGIVGAALALVASQTRFGRHLYATGGNRLAAELAGIRTRTKIRRMYLIMGLLYALTGIILASRLNGASPVGAPFLELDAVSANVIGGVRLGGGVGSVGGAFLGAILLSGVANGLSLMGVETFYQFIASGLILIFAVFLDLRIRHRGA